MKIKYKETIGSYTIISGIGNATVDIELTKASAASMVTNEMTKEDIERLYEKNVQYAKVGPEGDLITDELGDQIQRQLDGRGEHRQLLDSGEYIDDFRNVEYWLRDKSGRWIKEKVAGIGEAVPKGGIVLNQLAEDQRREIEAEIAGQREADRIAALTPEQKAEEKKSKLHALAREALQKAEEAELLEEDFDKIAWLQPQKTEIEALYA
jgi:hypothetical protein